MKKFLLIFVILVFIIGGFLYLEELQRSKVISVNQEFDNFDSIILKNTVFKTFEFNNFSFKYPDWQELDMDPVFLWPKEVVAKRQILLYLTNSDGIKMVVTRKKVENEYLEKPYPLVLREAFLKDDQSLKDWDGVTDYWVVREKFFENGVIIESRIIAFGTANSSIQKLILIRENNSRFIYSIGISAKEDIFKDYRLLAEYIFNSVRDY